MPAIDEFRGWIRRTASRPLLTVFGLGGLAAATFALVSGADAGAADPLRVCADPDNMPFSNAAGEGFENKLSEMIAATLGRPLAYTWAAQDENFIHGTLAARHCDVVIGVPKELGSVAVTRPYYWSSYVLVSRTDRHLEVTSLKDHQLRKLKIGVASVAGNRMFSPPAQALSQLGMVDNVVGYPIDGLASHEARARIIDDVASGEIDLAALWGPSAGYFVNRSPVPLAMTVIGDTDEFSARKSHVELLGLQFEIAMAVRKGDDALRRKLDQAIVKNEQRIRTLLKEFGVPLVEPGFAVVAAEPRGSSD